MAASRLSWFLPVVCLFVPALPFVSLLRAATAPVVSPEVLEASRVFLEFDAAADNLALRVGLDGEERFQDLLRDFPLPTPRVMVQIWG